MTDETCPVCGKGGYEWDGNSLPGSSGMQRVSHLDCVRTMTLDRNRYKKLYETWSAENAARADRTLRRAVQAEAELAVAEDRICELVSQRDEAEDEVERMTEDRALLLCAAAGGASCDTLYGDAGWPESESDYMRRLAAWAVAHPGDLTPDAKCAMSRWQSREEADG